MSCTPNYTEWTREEKEEFAERRMREMKEKNEKLLKRYTEVEHDRIEAESRNSAVTKVPKGPKKESKYEAYMTESKVEHKEWDREWDKGKPDKDNWKSPDRRGSFKNYRSGRYEKKDTWNSSSRNESNESWQDYTSGGHQERNANRNDSWGNYSRNENSDQYRHDRSSEIMQNRKARGNYRCKQYDDQQNTRLHRSPKRARGVGYRSRELQRNSQQSYSDEKYKKSDYNRSNSKKKYSYRAHSRSSSRSGSDFVANNLSSMPISSIRALSLWQNDKISEDQTKQNRVEKWVKSVNKSNWGRGKPFPPDLKEKNKNRSFSKFERSSGGSSDESDCRTNFAGVKNRENNNKTPQKPEYHSNEGQNAGAFFYSGSNSSRQVDRGIKTKHSPLYSSAPNNKNDQFRKRRFDNKEQEKRSSNEEKNKFVKCGMPENNDYWNSSATEGRFSKRENTKFSNVAAWNQGNDSWKNTVTTQANEDTWQTADQSQADDGWETAEQSDIKWNLSDDEIEIIKESNIKNVKQDSMNKNSSGSLKSNREMQQNDKKEVAQFKDPGDSWSHEQGKRNFKSPSAKGKGEATDGWEDYECSPVVEISKKMERKCKISDKMEVVEGTAGRKVSKNVSNLNVKAAKPEQSSCTLSEKSHEKNTAGSDGWSTVSEEDDDNPDSEWKKDNITN